MIKPLKILFFVEHFKLSGSGAENDAVFLCRELARRGYHVHVVADTADDISGVHVHGGLKGVSEIAQQLSPDVTIDLCLRFPANIHRLGGGVHKDFLKYSLSAYPLPWRWIKRMGYLKRKHRDKVRNQRALLEDRKSRFLAISKFVARQAEASGADPSSVSVLYNGVDTKRFDASSIHTYRTDVRNRWGISGTDVVCLFVAHNLRLKNLALLRMVFNGLHRSCPSLKLVVVGKRKPFPPAPYLCHQEAIYDIERVYSAADMLLHPSYFDAFGNVVLEAMSCSLPVVVSGHCGVSELIDDRKNGIVLPLSSSTSNRNIWERAVSELYRDPAYRKQLGHEARITALDHTFAGYVDLFEKIIHQIISSKNQSTCPSQAQGRSENNGGEKAWETHGP